MILQKLKSDAEAVSYTHLLLIRGVQLAVADVVGDGAGEQMGVLQDDAQGPAQGCLLYTSRCV